MIFKLKTYNPCSLMDDFAYYVNDETEYYAYYEQGIKQKDINRIFENFFNNFNDVLSKYFNEDDYNQVYSELFSELGSLLSKDDNEKNINNDEIYQNKIKNMFLHNTILYKDVIQNINLFIGEQEKKLTIDEAIYKDEPELEFIIGGDPRGTWDLKLEFNYNNIDFEIAERIQNLNSYDREEIELEASDYLIDRDFEGYENYINEIISKYSEEESESESEESESEESESEE